MNVLSFAFFLLVCANAKIIRKRNDTPPPPFDQPGGFTFVRGGNIYSPTPLGKKDLVITDDQILAILDSKQTDQMIAGLKDSGIIIKSLNASGLTIIPGLIDVHVHASGAGGEMGPWSRTPEGYLSAIINAGITTMIGLLGTDGVTRDLRSVLQKMNELDHDGITTYMWTGAYRVPVPTLTSEVQTDITLINKVLGVGELAISDHRSSWPSYQELVRIVSDCRVAGLLSGKPGVVHFHLGSAGSELDLLWQIVNETTIPITQMYPTHMSSRGPALLDQAKDWIAAGGFCDFTADEVNETDTIDAILEFDQEGIDLSHLTLSSDAFGSLPEFDEQGQLIGYGVGQPITNLQTIQKLVIQYKWPIQKAIQFNTINPATYLGFTNKGQIKVNGDADLVLLDASLNPSYVFAKGQCIKTPTWTKKQMFEP